MLQQQSSTPTTTTSTMPSRRPFPLRLLATALLVLLASPCRAFVLPVPCARPAPSTRRTTMMMRPQPHDDGTPPIPPLAPLNKLARSTTTLLLSSSALSPLLPLPAAHAADLSPLPADIKANVLAMREAVLPLNLRDAAKALSETPGLDELSFDDAARRAVNTELKELQAARPDLWDAETSYYGGVIRRAVNPFHVIELVPLLKVGVEREEEKKREGWGTRTSMSCFRRLRSYSFIHPIKKHRWVPSSVEWATFWPFWCSASFPVSSPWRTLGPWPPSCCRRCT